jgi:UDP-GlcNAc:undecaprenyl-phosphate GlcNAc-1-phosphate transferase
VLIVFGVTYLLNIFAIAGESLNDTILLGLLLLVTVSLYLVLRYLTNHGGVTQLNLASNLPLRKTVSYRKLVRQSGICAFIIKYLIITLLLLPVLLSQDEISQMSLFPVLLLGCSVLIFVTSSIWQNQLLQLYIYVSGSYLIYLLETYGRDDSMLGVPLNVISHAAFMLLLLCVVTKTLLRNRTSRLVTTPLEYFVLLIVLSVPLIPQELIGVSHLMTVAAKSVVLFVAFKLVMMRQMNKNRRIMLAIAVTCLILMLRRFFG